MVAKLSALKSIDEELGRGERPERTEEAPPVEELKKFEDDDP